MSKTTKLEAKRAQLDDTCAKALQLALDGGAEGAEVCADYADEVSSSIEQNELSAVSAAEHYAFGITVLREGRVGFSYVNRFDDASLRAAVDDALAIAAASGADEANGFVSPEPLTEVDGLHDPAFLALGPDDAAEAAAEMLATAKGVDRRVSVDGAYGVTATASAVHNSLGVKTSGIESYGSFGLYGMAVTDDEVGAFDHEYRGIREAKGFALEEVALAFAEKVLAHLGPKAAQSYKGKVVFSSDAFEGIFLSAIYDAIDGDRVLKGKSKWGDKIGAQVASPLISIVDDGTKKGGIGSSHFDREGLPHRRFSVLDQGVLGGFMYDGKTARRAGQKSTGHASGSARGTPGIGGTNIDVLPGTTSEKELLDMVGDGLFVGRLAGNVDGTSGDFSGVAKNSFWVSGGKRQHPVKETLIAGNAFALLDKVVAVGDTLHGDFATKSPWVVIDGVDVTAG